MSEFVMNYRKDLEEKIKHLNIELYEITNCLDCKPDVKNRMRHYLYCEYSSQLGKGKSKDKDKDIKIKIEGNRALKEFDNQYKIPEEERKYL